MAKTVDVSIEQNQETSGFTVFVQHESGWVAKLVSDLPLEAALVVVETDLEKLQDPEIEFCVGALRCAQVKEAIEALRTEATFQQRSETRLRALALAPARSERDTEVVPGECQPSTCHRAAQSNGFLHSCVESSARRSHQS